MASAQSTAVVTGGTIGTKRTVVIAGLAPATAYQFQLVAYRGTLDMNAVFGALSNVASAATLGTILPPVPPPSLGAWPNEPAGFRLLNDQPWKERLIELQMMIEVGEITEEEYVAQEKQVFAALRDIRARREEIARAAAASRGEEEPESGIGIYTGYGER